jgi:hypothetical protein
VVDTAGTLLTQLITNRKWNREENPDAFDALTAGVKKLATKKSLPFEPRPRHLLTKKTRQQNVNIDAPITSHVLHSGL